MKLIGVIGAGTMGNGIAHVCALNGKKVIISDISKEFLDKGYTTIDRNLQRMVKKDRITSDEMSTALDNISLTTDMNDLKDADLVVEAATENFEIKKKIFTDLDSICNSDAFYESGSCDETCGNHPRIFDG